MNNNTIKNAEHFQSVIDKRGLDLAAEAAVDEDDNNTSDLKYEGYGVLTAGLRNWMGKNTQWREQIADFIDRRDTARFAAMFNKNYKYFLDEALKQGCICKPDKYAFARSMIKAIRYHHGKSMKEFSACPNLLPRLGGFLADSYSSSFKDRRQTLVISGAPGSGKSTLVRAISLVFPEYLRVFGFLCFRATYGLLFLDPFCYRFLRYFRSQVSSSDTFPYSSLRDHHRLVEFSDIRLNENLPVSSTLNFLDKRDSLQVSRKNKDALVLSGLDDTMILVTSNYLEASRHWNNIDVEAFYDRCAPNLVLQYSLPQRNNCIKATCSYLAIAWFALPWGFLAFFKKIRAPKIPIANATHSYCSGLFSTYCSQFCRDADEPCDLWNTHKAKVYAAFGEKASGDREFDSPPHKKAFGFEAVAKVGREAADSSSSASNKKRDRVAEKDVLDPYDDIAEADLPDLQYDEEEGCEFYDYLEGPQ